MTPAQIDEVKDFYLGTFTAPLFRVAKVDELKTYIGIAADVLEVNTGVVFGATVFSLTKELIESTKIINVDQEPLVGISIMTLEGEDLLTEDYPYELLRSSISFITAISAGTFEMTYSSGLTLGDKEKKALSLMVNHLVETKMVDSERIGIITTVPDRNIIPREVKSILGISNLEIGFL